MTSRESFEAHFKKEFPRADLSWQPLMAVYATSQVEVAWSIWQAAERQALESAAQRAEQKAGDCHTLGNAEEFRELAAAIRALNESKED